MKQIWKLIIVIPIIIGIVVAILITFKNQSIKIDKKNKLENIFGNLTYSSAEITKFYTYGTSLNIEGKIKGISEDNFEGIKAVVLDGKNFEKIYRLDYVFNEGDVNFSTGENINNAINLDELPSGNKYFVQIRIKANNSKDYKYYTLSNISDYKNIEYYTLTKKGKNNKIDIKFEKQNFNDKEYNYLGLNVAESKVPEAVYDIVVDSGHGGTDKGEVNGSETESDLMLDYGKSLKDALEEKGYKVKLTRDDLNTDSFTDKNMYDEDGRISISCKTKAKYMISLHTADEGYSGIEVYIPNNCDISLASTLANNIFNSSSLEFSNNKLYKKQDGVYQKNYNKDAITTYTANLKKQGIEPYEITTNTPRLYTIREVGGIATHAYVDGRNTNFSANKFYNSNQGIECYQISVGSIKENKDVLLNEKEQIIKAISDAF